MFNVLIAASVCCFRDNNVVNTVTKQGKLDQHAKKFRAYIGNRTKDFPVLEPKQL